MVYQIELQRDQAVMLDSAQGHVVAARAKQDFLRQVGQERQGVAMTGRQVSQSLEFEVVGVGQRIDPGPSRERFAAVPSWQLVIPAGQERLALFDQLRLVTCSMPVGTSLDRLV